MLIKKQLIQQIMLQLDQELLTITESAKAAYEAATHEESKAEDQHDTRGIEASYLADAQAGRLADLKQLILMYRFLPIREFKSDDQMAIGALAELDLDGKRSFYFLVNQGGGLSVRLDNKAIQVITPRAPLGNALVGKRVGDVIEVESQNFYREYKLMSLF